MEALQLFEMQGESDALVEDEELNVLFGLDHSVAQEAGEDAIERDIRKRDARRQPRELVVQVFGRGRQELDLDRDIAGSIA